MAYVFFFFQTTAKRDETNRSSEKGGAFVSATEANEKGCAGVGSIPLREPSTRSRRGSRRVEGPGARRLARLGPARRKHGASEGRARSSPWHSWCCSLVPGRTSPWSSGLLSFHSLLDSTSCASETRPLVPVPLFFFLSPSGGGGEPLTKISSSRIQKFPHPHPALFPKIGSKSRHTQELGLESYSRSGFPRATRSGNGHRSHGRRATSEPTPRSKALRPRQRSRRSGAREIGRAKTLARGSARVPRFRQICGLQGRG